MKIFRRFLDVNGCRVFYRDTLTDKPAIVCLHGRFGRGETWIDLINRYGEKFRVIAPDQRGHGLSDKPVSQYTAEELADDIAELICQLECQPSIVVGHSMGGRVAGYLATRRPELVRAVALLDHSPFAGRQKPTRKSLDEIPSADAFTESWPLPFPSARAAREYISYATNKSNTLSEYFLDSLMENKDGYSMMFSQQATSAIFEYQHAWGALLPTLNCPVMIVRAKDSGDISDEDWDRMKGVIPTNYAFEVSKPDHHVYLSDPAEFFTEFDRFLSHFC